MDFGYLFHTFHTEKPNLKNFLFLLLMLASAGIVTAQDEAARVIIDRIDEEAGPGGSSNRRIMSTIVWNTTRENPRLAKKGLTYTIANDETGEDVKGNEYSGSTGDHRWAPNAGVITTNRRANPVEVDGTKVERRNRTMVNGEEVDADVIDMTTLPPGDYTIRAKNRRGKDKAEIKVKIKGQKKNQKTT